MPSQAPSVYHRTCSVVAHRTLSAAAATTSCARRPPAGRGVGCKKGLPAGSLYRLGTHKKGAAAEMPSPPQRCPRIRTLTHNSARRERTACRPARGCEPATTTTMAATITKVLAREIFDSRGNPTVEVGACTFTGALLVARGPGLTCHPCYYHDIAQKSQPRTESSVRMCLRVPQPARPRL